ncbi:MAG: acetolactate synthase isozyme1 large subunit, partial [Alphaproteobacteria bacterium]
RRGQLHQMRDQAGAARAVARWSEVAADAKAAAVLLDRAFAGFAAARPGPCVMHVPISALGETAGPLPPPSAVPARPAADPAIVEEVAARIRAAERPLFVFGGGAARSGATASARRVLALAGAAAFTTYAGRGVVAPDWPLLFGSFLARPDSSAVVASADLVVAVGTELSEVDLWRPQLGHACPLVRVDLDPEVLADDHRADLPVLADAAGFLAALEAALSGNRPATGWRPAEVAEARARWRAQADAERPGILPVIDALRAAVPSAATIFSDMTQFAYLAKEVWDMPAPGRWHHPFGFGTLGYALPAAIGGKIGLGAQPVVAIAGDHGLQYTLPELAVAVERGLSLPIIVWDNGKLKEIEDCMIDAQMSPRATTARNPDFLALARAYGARAAEPKGAAGIRAAMAEALAAPVPTLIRLTPESLGGAPG